MHAGKRWLYTDVRSVLMMTYVRGSTAPISYSNVGPKSGRMVYPAAQKCDPVPSPRIYNNINV